MEDRTAEHLVSSDKAIVAARKLLLAAIDDVEEGRDPRHVVREPEKNSFQHLVVLSEVVSASTDWKQYLKKVAAEDRFAMQNGK